MLMQVWKIITRTVLIIGLLLLFLVAVELLRVFDLFHDISPTLAWGYLAVIGIGVLALGIYWITNWTRYPRALKPPPLADPRQASHAQLRRYSKYLRRYLGRLARNPGLGPEEAQLARERIADIKDVLRSHPLNDDLVRAIEQAETQAVIPLLGRLEEIAEREVRRSVRDVMLGVALSPFHSVDVFVVLYRNSAMILRIARVYASRPAPGEQILVLRDTLRVVAAVNLLNLGRTLLESLFAHVPVIGRVIDDIGQGLGAGLLTSAAGHAAIERCSAYRGWNKEQATESLAGHAVQFATDVKDIFAKDILPALKGRIRASVPEEQTSQPGFWENVSKGVANAVDTTARATGNYIILPAVAGTQGVVKAGFWVTRGAFRAGSRVTHSTARTGMNVLRGVSRVARGVGTRIRKPWRRKKPPS